MPILVRATWIPDSNALVVFGFLELYSGFQSPGFWIPQAKYFRIPDGPTGSTKNSRFRNPDSLTCGERREALVPGVELSYESGGDARRKF